MINQFVVSKLTDVFYIDIFLSVMAIGHNKLCAASGMKIF